MRDVSFAPDGSYFIIASTGGQGTNTDGTRSSCDTVGRWETSATGSNVRPTWLNYSGVDSFTGLAVTGTAIYAGGHQRWMNNTFGADSAAEGAVPRPGIAALDPANGMPFSWNPGRNPRGVGAFALFANAQGLYVGSDTEWIGNFQYQRKRLAFFPLAGGTVIPTPTTAALPSNVYLAGQLPDSTNTNILYRVNAGGPAIQASDNGPDWSADQASSSPYRNSGSNTAGWSPVPTVDATVPASTPRAIFDSERWDPGSKGDGQEMHWSFPVTAGTQVEVRLYFANRYGGTSQVGQRVFDVAVNGSTVMDNYDIVAAVGHDTGTARTFTVTSTGVITIDFGHEVENPLINGIEIVRAGSPPPSSALDSLRFRPYDGATVGPTTTVPNPGNITWSQTRGAFMVGNTLFYGWTDSNLYRRSFDGTTLGPPTLIDPYNDPVWSDVATGPGGGTYRGVKPTLYGQLPNVTGMFYADNRVYYAQFGQQALFSRYFEPESGIVGADEFQTTGVNLSNIAGMFRSGSNVYYASRADGTLHRVGFTNGALVPGSDTVVSGPSIDGNDWRARGMFLLGSSPPPNQPPAASFSVSCQQLTCSFDGSASSDPDGTVTSWAWNFGDNTTGTGQSTSHTYAAAGTYTVTLTVTDNQNATGTTSNQANPTDGGGGTSISFVGSASTNGNVSTATVTVPASVTAGDGMLLFATDNTTAFPSTPAGWTTVSTLINGSMVTAVWKKVAAGGDANAPVSVTYPSISKVSLQLLAYRGTDPSDPVAAHASAADATSSASHTTPTAPVGTAGSWAVSYWADKSGTTTVWNPPGGVTVRDTSYGTGSSYIAALLADSGGPVPLGNYGGLTATTNAAAPRAEMWTIVLRPAP
jgi:PKD repeat protein